MLSPQPTSSATAWQPMLGFEDHSKSKEYSHIYAVSGQLRQPLHLSEANIVIRPRSLRPIFSLPYLLQMRSRIRSWSPIRVHHVFPNLPPTSLNQLAVKDSHRGFRKRSRGGGSGYHNYPLPMGRWWFPTRKITILVWHHLHDIHSMLLCSPSMLILLRP